MAVLANALGRMVLRGLAAGDLVYGLCCPLPVKLQTPLGTVLGLVRGGCQSLKDGKGGQAHRCAAAADRPGRASLLTLFGLALEVVDLIFAEDFALELSMSKDGKRLGCSARCREDGSILRSGLLTEGCRGEAGILRNWEGKPFVARVAPVTMGLASKGCGVPRLDR